MLSVNADKDTENSRFQCAQGSCGVKTTSPVCHLTLEDSTVCACARHHPREDAMDLLQFLNSNIVKFVLTVQKKNTNKPVDKE